MSAPGSGGDFGNPLRKFKLVFLGEQSGESRAGAEQNWEGLAGRGQRPGPCGAEAALCPG